MLKSCLTINKRCAFMYKGTPLYANPIKVFGLALQPPFLFRKSQHPTLFQGLWGLNRPVILVTVGAVINDR